MTVIILPSYHDFSPEELADLGFWVDANQIIGGPWLDGQTPPVWNDLSVNSQDLDNTATFRTNRINGLPAMRTNSFFTSENLAADGSLLFGTNFATIYTVHFAVGGQNTLPLRVEQFSSTTNLVECFYFFGINALNFQFNTIVSGALPALNVWYGTEWYRNGATGQIQQVTAGSGFSSSGTFTGSLPNPANMDRIVVFNGNKDPAGLEIAEILVYKRALSAGERTQVKDYLTGKYNL